MPSARAIHLAARAELDRCFAMPLSTREPYASLHPAFLRASAAFARWPAPEEYDALAATVPRQPDVELPRFVVQSQQRLRELGGYERHVARARGVPTRPRCWHDFFNMAVWAHFPRVRWALNALHVDETLGPVDPRNGRAPQQNAASQLDESGLIVASSSAQLLADLRALRFKRVLWDGRQELLATTRFFVVGHGTLESLLAPHLGLACKAVLLQLPRTPGSYQGDELRFELDARVAQAILGWRQAAPVLDPVPVLGIPGYADNGRPEFYDDARYFRFQRATASTRACSSAMNAGGSGNQ